MASDPGTTPGGSFGALVARHRTTGVAVLASAGPVGAAVTALPNTLTCLLLVVFVIVSAAVLPRLARFGIALEDRLNLRTGLLVPGRLLRVLVLIPSLVVVGLLLPDPLFLTVSGLGVSVGAGAGSASVATRLAYRGVGDRATNSVFGYAAIFWAMSAAGLPVTRPAASAGMVLLAAVFVLDLARSCLSDLRGRFPRHGGVGIFFGTFNPVHKTHMEIVRAAIAQRGLEKVFIHPTTVPKLHRDALAAREIEFNHRDGMRVYRKTSRADPNKDYFPTGNMFFEYEVRNELLKASVQDAGLSGCVQVLELSDLYEAEGFLGIARRIRKDHPGKGLHGLHGSDPGGMWVRNLFEACGGITPFPVCRRDDVSATAIRKGGVGMTTPTVERFLAAVRGSDGFTFPNGFVFEPGRAAAASKGTIPVSDLEAIPIVEPRTAR